jgi:hypothetical protein
MATRHDEHGMVLESVRRTCIFGECEIAVLAGGPAGTVAVLALRAEIGASRVAIKRLKAATVRQGAFPG